MKKLWFKRKVYGWGWYPAAWQGWVVTLVCVSLILLFAQTVDENSPVREVVFTFLFPVAILTLIFFKIALQTGEKPHWQWGK